MIAHVEIESEVLKWSPADRINLAERLLESVDGFASKDIDVAWRAEIKRRVEDVESGKETGVASSKVYAEARRKLNEARKVSSTRSK